MEKKKKKEEREEGGKDVQGLGGQWHARGAPEGVFPLFLAKQSLHRVGSMSHGVPNPRKA